MSIFRRKKQTDAETESLKSFLDMIAPSIVKFETGYLSFSNVSKDSDDIKEQLNEAQKEAQELRELSQELTSEQLSVFLALLDIGKFNYSEQFDATLDFVKESSFDRMWSIWKIASDFNYIVAGLKKCGQPYFFRLLTENCTNANNAN